MAEKQEGLLPSRQEAFLFSGCRHLSDYLTRTFTVFPAPERIYTPGMTDRLPAPFSTTPDIRPSAPYTDTVTEASSTNMRPSRAYALKGAASSEEIPSTAATEELPTTT